MNLYLGRERYPNRTMAKNTTKYVVNFVKEDPSQLTVS